MQVFDLTQALGIWIKPETFRHQASSSTFLIQYLKVLIWVCTISSFYNYFVLVSVVELEKK